MAASASLDPTLSNKASDFFNLLFHGALDLIISYDQEWSGSGVRQDKNGRGVNGCHMDRLSSRSTPLSERRADRRPRIKSLKVHC